MATQKQKEKLNCALSIEMITKNQYDAAMIDAEYCYKLIGDIMMESRNKLIFSGFNYARTFIATEAIKYI